MAAWLKLTGFGLDDWINWQLLLHSSITTAHNQWLPKNHSIPYWTVTDLVLSYESITSSASVVRWLTLHSWTLNPTQPLSCPLNSVPTKSVRASQSFMLRPTVSRPVCLGTKHPSGAYDQIFISVWQLRVCSCGGLSVTRGRVCRLKLLLVLASAVILVSEPRGTRDHILLSQIRDFPFSRLLRLAGLRWRYSTPPPFTELITCSPFVTSGRSE
jgi:hypothetical protein